MVEGLRQFPQRWLVSAFAARFGSEGVFVWKVLSGGSSLSCFGISADCLSSAGWVVKTSCVGSDYDWSLDQVQAEAGVYRRLGLSGMVVPSLVDVLKDPLSGDVAAVYTRLPAVAACTVSDPELLVDVCVKSWDVCRSV